MSRNDETTKTATDVDPTDIDLSRQETQPSQLPALTGAVALGRYIVGDQVGAGGTSVVFRGHDPELKRDVAIKLVVPRTARDRERLLDEARAMAKLDHRAVMPVFDVGLTSDGVYVVMPHIAGGTLDQWLRATGRPWREILERFLEAGRGLAAAHAAGLIHHDFKPQNVLIDGNHVLVAAFALVAESASDDEAPATFVAGTPGYMAPEQASGGPVDARADQYSFCVSLWESLCGERPAETPSRSMGKRLPSWLLSALARGRATAPDERWPSLGALLVHIEQRLRRRRRMVAAALLIGALGATGTAALALRSGAAPAECSQPHSRMTGVWDHDVKQRIQESFESIAGTGGDDAFARTLFALEEYARSWRIMHVAACRASRETRSQDVGLLDRQIACLDVRLGLFRTLAATLTDTRDVGLIRKAPQLVGDLAPIADCASSDQLLAVPPPPVDPSIRAQLANLNAELDAIWALKWQGALAENLRRAGEALATARVLGDLPTLARALQILQLAQVTSGRYDRATSRELAQVAAQAGRDDLAANAWLYLLEDLTTHQTSYDEARALEAAAHAAILRAGSPAVLLFREQLYLGLVAFNTGDYGKSREHTLSALELAPTLAGRAEAELNLAKVTMLIDGPSAALPLAERALAVFEKRFGPDHTLVGEPLLFLAQIHSDVGDLGKARELVLRALALQEHELPADSIDLAIMLKTLGTIEASLELTADAKDHLQRAIDGFEKGGDVARHALALGTLAEVVAQDDGLAAARPIHQRSLAELEPVMGKEWLFYALTEVGYARSLVDGGACSETGPLLEHAIRVFEKEMPPYVGFALWLRARCHMAARRFDPAVADLESADQRCRKGDCGAHPEILLALGTLLVERGRDTKRGVALVQEARTKWSTRGLKARVAEADAWLAKH